MGYPRNRLVQVGGLSRSQEICLKGLKWRYAYYIDAFSHPWDFKLGWVFLLLYSLMPSSEKQESTSNDSQARQGVDRPNNEPTTSGGRPSRSASVEDWVSGELVED